MIVQSRKLKRGYCVMRDYKPETLRETAKTNFENRIIGQILTTPESIEYYNSLPFEYLTKENQRIFKAIRTLSKGNKDRSLIMLKLKNKISGIDFNKYLSFDNLEKFHFETFAKENIKEFCGLVYEEETDRLIKQYQRGEIEFSVINTELNKIESKFPRIEPIETYSTFENYVIEAVSGLYKPLISQKYSFVSKAFGGLELGNLITITAKSGVGKSLLTLQLLWDLILTNESKGILYSLEMSKLELIQRLVSQKFNIDPLSLRNRSYFKTAEYNEVKRITEFVKESEKSLFIKDSIFNLTAIENDITHTKELFPELKFVAVDFVNIVKCTTKGENKYLELREIMESFKQIAITQKLIFIIVAQNNRQGDISDSFGIFQLSDFLLNLSRPINEAEKPKEIKISGNTIPITHNLFLLSIEKNRHTAFNNNKIPFLLVHNNLMEMDLTRENNNTKSNNQSYYDSQSEKESI